MDETLGDCAVGGFIDPEYTYWVERSCKDAYAYFCDAKSELIFKIIFLKKSYSLFILIFENQNVTLAFLVRGQSCTKRIFPNKIWLILIW